MRVTKTNCGFTLLELIIVVAMMAIVLAIAIPSFRSTIQNNYSLTLANQLIIAFNFARSEAIKRDLPVSVCAAATSALTSCGTNWTNGWIVFVDNDGGGTISSGDIILRTETLTGDSAVITSSPSINAATYSNNGFPATNTANATFTVYATGCTSTNARTIAISFSGRTVVTPFTCP